MRPTPSNRAAREKLHSFGGAAVGEGQLGDPDTFRAFFGVFELNASSVCGTVNLVIGRTGERTNREMTSKLERLRATATRIREVAAERAERAKGQLEVIVGAGATGYVRGRYSTTPEKLRVGEIDLEVPIGLVGLAADHFKLLGRASDDAGNVATGILASYVSMRLFEMGERHAAESTAGVGALGQGTPWQGMPHSQQQQAVGGE